MKLNFFLFFLNLILLLSSVNSDDDDENNISTDAPDDETEKSTSSPDPEVNQFPSLVEIRIGRLFLCPGILIGPKHVLASAKCFIPRTGKEQYKVNCYANRLDPKEPPIGEEGEEGGGGGGNGEEHGGENGEEEEDVEGAGEVIKICVHPKYRARAAQEIESSKSVNNIAILQIRSSLADTSKCTPAEISKDKIRSGTKCDIVGWVPDIIPPPVGEVKFTLSSVVKKNVLQCFRYVFVLPWKHTCVLAEHLKHELRNHCPLYCKGQLEGIVSYFKNVKNISVLVTTKVSGYNKWIEFFIKTGEMDYCAKASQQNHFPRNILLFIIITIMLQYF